jgi:hypothetical protein
MRSEGSTDAIRRRPTAFRARDIGIAFLIGAAVAVGIVVAAGSNQQAAVRGGVHVLEYMYMVCYVTIMAKSTPRPPLVREPVQVYLAPDDSALLNRLATETGLPKAEILRRGVKSFAREHGGAVTPMLRFLAESTPEGWPDAVAADHDAVLAETYQPSRKKRR